jgi:hypothetical protein
MDGIISFGTKRSYDEFKKQISPKIKSYFDLLRDFCFSLGENVIEDVRMHRIVFCKSITFRWFVDMEPEMDAIIIKIQKSRKEPSKKILVKPNDDLDEIKCGIKDAYITIR